MAENIAKTFIEAPAAVTKGDSPKKAVISALGNAIIMGISTVVGIVVNKAIKAKMPTANPYVVDGVHIAGGAALCAVKNDTVRVIGLGQSLAGGISLLQPVVEKALGPLVSKFEPVSTSTPTGDGW